MMRIGINCGHTVSGTIGSGAVGYINESNETRNVGYRLMDYLRQRGVTVIDCTNDYASSVSENLSDIVAKANAQSLDLFVSVHFNSGGGKGCEVFTYGGKKHDEAVRVCEKLNELGFVNRGIKDGSSLYVVRRTDSKAMLIEVCFVDTKTDTDLYKSIGPARIAQAIAEAITGQEDNNMKVKDISGHWAEPAIQKLVDYGIVNGDESGNFCPDKPATKAEVAQMIAGALSICGK